MNTATYPKQLQQLEQRLQQALQLRHPEYAPLKVLCTHKSNRLMVVVEHEPTVLPELDQILGSVSAIMSAMATPGQEPQPWFLAHPLQVYLWVERQPRPYASRSLNIQTAGAQVAGAQAESPSEKPPAPPAPLTSTTPSAPPASLDAPHGSRPSDESDRPDDFSIADDFSLTGEFNVPEEFITAADLEALQPSNDALSEHFSDESGDESTAASASEDYERLVAFEHLARAAADNSTSAPEPPQHDSTPGAIALHTDRAAFEPDLDEHEDIPLGDRPSWFSPTSLPAVALSITVGLLSLAGCTYLLTRPCVIGGCALLQEAESAGQTSLQTLQTTQSADAVVAAYDTLLDINYQLGTVPRWSPHHSSAQALLRRYEADTDGVGLVVKALQIGNLAAQKSQNPPHPLPQWREVKELWQEAIALLQQIPADSPVAPLVTRKLSEYQANLTTIDQRLAIEIKAQGEITAARSTAQLAETRQGIAKSVSEWESAYLTWQSAIAQLQRVPTTTMSYAEAQQLLEIYQAKLATTQQHRDREAIAADAYGQALDSAAQAQTAEQRSQWSQSVSLWQSALTYAQQVPQNTSYRAQIEPLIATYQTALSQAQSQLRIAAALQAEDARLQQACTNTPPVCTYNIVDGKIQIRLAPYYDQVVRQMMIQVPAAGTVDLDAMIRANTLLRVMATVGDRAQTSVDFYNADGQIFGSYDPTYAGYVQR